MCVSPPAEQNPGFYISSANPVEFERPMENLKVQYHVQAIIFEITCGTKVDLDILRRSYEFDGICNINAARKFRHCGTVSHIFLRYNFQHFQRPFPGNRFSKYSAAVFTGD